MTTQEKLIKGKLGLLELAAYMENVSEACKTLGYSRDTFYRVKRRYEEAGIEGLREISRRKPNPRNRVPQEIEDKVCGLALEYPAYGRVRIANKMSELYGLTVSPAGVRCIWQRHELERKKKRLKALEAKMAEGGYVLTESQVQALEQATEERKAHGEIETEHPGYLGSQDTFYVGTMKGVGRIYQQTYIDTFCRHAHAKLYLQKSAITAADLLNDRVIPFYEAEGIDVLRILTDRGTEYCGKVDKHEYQLYLALNDIEHTKTKVKSPQTNGICERFHKTILEEFYQVALRRKIYTSIEELQADLDAWLDEYNHRRPHQGKRCDGRTPYATLTESKHLAEAKQLSA
ncbi:MAG TPA: IS481 family transposase [Candidatus Krumholzibacteria bacterium]|nr:IS481 family transposase [Candidatus Krumholzibacteria bacterium]